MKTWSIEECWHKLRTGITAPCRAALTVNGKHFRCDNTKPHHSTHTSGALRARWDDTEVTR
jgi:hypothetical protein